MFFFDLIIIPFRRRCTTGNGENLLAEAVLPTTNDQSIFFCIQVLSPLVRDQIMGNHTRKIALAAIPAGVCL
jgi:hypothetical protein